MSSPAELMNIAQSVATLLRETHSTLVLAESCTAGLIAATLSRIPGISEFLAGSAVVYQLKTKHAWLDVSPEIMEDPGVVSAAVAEAMVRGVLANTPQAGVAASITGHLGPNAPPELDGIAWCAIQFGSKSPTCHRLMLEPRENSSDRRVADPVAVRYQRQCDAVQQVLQLLATRLTGESR
ncbi:MAG: nicotinamide-nucleotide amidohydrolase family protein [Planctomycetaceae bacterium]|nr:nicotinamide-nucleotide amidohydrolase family protein [Planctomycetaceae bacterium]